MYRCYLYKMVEEKIVSKIFQTETEVEAAMQDGWVDTPARFLPQDTPMEAVDLVLSGATDRNILLNIDKIRNAVDSGVKSEDDAIQQLEDLGQRYFRYQFRGRKTIKGMIKKLKKLEAEYGNGTASH